MDSSCHHTAAEAHAGEACADTHAAATSGCEATSGGGQCWAASNPDNHWFYDCSPSANCGIDPHSSGTAWYYDDRDYVRIGSNGYYSSPAQVAWYDSSDVL